jgi:hypothetical protein
LYKRWDQGFVFIVIDEVQTLVKRGQEMNDSFLAKLLTTLFVVAKCVRQDGIHRIPIFSGTDPKRVLSQFVSSGYEFAEIVLPLLHSLHFDDIITKLQPKGEEIPPLPFLKGLIQVFTAGHPRIFESFISVASEIFAMESESEVTVSLKVKFHLDGFITFLKSHQRNQDFVWAIAEKTWHQLQRHLPSLTTFLNGKRKFTFNPSYLSSHPPLCCTADSESLPYFYVILQKLLSRNSKDRNVNRNALVLPIDYPISNPKSWGDLEATGAIFLGATPAGKPLPSLSLPSHFSHLPFR